MNLGPAKWIWLPSSRCLPNTFILFRYVIDLDEDPVRASGWITADSRYLLRVDGIRIQWGLAPCDPRWLEADPIDLTGVLTKGRHVLAVQVLYFGTGDGTYPMGSPGLLLRLDLEMPDGSRRQVVTDHSWQTYLDRAHRPGMYKRWFLRALQEDFDARRHPWDWDIPSFAPDAGWLPAMELPGRPDKPAIFAGGPEYVLSSEEVPPTPDQPASIAAPALVAREIPLLREEMVPVQRMADAGRVLWHRDPADWFESRIPGSMEVVREPEVVTEIQPPSIGGAGAAASWPAGQQSDRQWCLPAPPLGQGVFATFEFKEQMVGFPAIVIDAPAGTVVELIFQESHDLKRGPAWLDSHYFQWATLVCKEGINEFEAADFESLRWLQIHVRNSARPVRIVWIGMRRRSYPWAQSAKIGCAEPPLQKLFDASLNTLVNSCQETCVDGMGRERQQYGGDGGHQIQTVRYAYGETQQGSRYLQTFSQGLTADGYFLDCWPAYDRLARLAQRQVGTTRWGPILDHGLGFYFACRDFYWDTGNLEALRQVYPRLIVFSEYLQRMLSPDGLLPVEHIGVPSVWLDHEAYTRQRHKQCAFNLYAAGALRCAMARLAQAFGDGPQAQRANALADRLVASVTARFWCLRRNVFVANLPWELQEGQTRYDDQSLAHSILCGFCPEGRINSAARILADCPPEMGLSYPANAIWRLRALAKVGRQDVILTDLRTRWADMSSVRCNNTLQETWQAAPDGTAQYSHCAVGPLQILFSGLLGISATAAGFARYEIMPRLADLQGLDVVAWTPVGPIHVAAELAGDGHRTKITPPLGGEGVLVTGANRRKLIPGEMVEVFVPAIKAATTAGLTDTPCAC